MLFSAYTGAGGFAGILIPLFVYIASLGFVLPNTTALAMEHHGRIAGSASALLGSLQFALGATAATIAGALGSGSAVPLGLVIAGCGSAACLINLTTKSPIGDVSTAERAELAENL